MSQWYHKVSQNHTLHEFCVNMLSASSVLLQSYGLEKTLVSIGSSPNFTWALSLFELLKQYLNTILYDFTMTQSDTRFPS